MRWGKRQSVGMGLAGLGLVLGTGLFVRSASRLQPLDLWDLLAVALAAGMVIGLLHSLTMGLLGGELRGLTLWVEALAATDGPAARFRSRLGLEEVAQAVENALGSARRRLDELVDHRRGLEVQLHQTQGRQRHGEAILHAIADGVLVTDAFGNVVLANRAAERLLGFNLAEAGPCPVERVVEDPLLVRLLKDAQANDPYQSRQVEHRLIRDGTTGIFNITLSGIPGPSADTDRPAPGAGGGMLAIFHDITREKEISEMKSDFVSNVSHELRTPLSSIKACVEMLVDGEARDEAARVSFYNIIQGEANRLDRLIDNILNINRIESGMVKIHRERVCLAAVVREAVEVMRPQARAKEIELVHESGQAVPEIFADKDMIYQAMLNLLSNAVKYTPAGGRATVTMELDPRGQRVSVSVSDTGVGIPPQDLAHLFEKFYRVQEHKSPKAPGWV